MTFPVSPPSFQDTAARADPGTRVLAGAVPRKKGLVLAAMIFAVAMTFIDQTIVALATPDLQADLWLSATGMQWIINAYLLSLSALFAFGGAAGRHRWATGGWWSSAS